MSNQIKAYKACWKQAVDAAEKELEEIYNQFVSNDGELLKENSHNLNDEEIKSQLNQTENDHYFQDNSDDQEDQQDQNDHQINILTQKTKEDFIVNQEIKRELLREVPYKEEKLQIYKIIYSNGDVYEGELSKDLKDGSGTYYYANGEKYDGLFSEDVIHGYGKYFFMGGHKYEGDWYQGEKSGMGILDFKTGDRYIGGFYKDVFDGDGIYLQKLIGTFQYRNGDVFKGKWKKGKKNGHGEMRYKDKRIVVGEWIDDKLQPF
ncbi:unnamed protein product (macronuclear) [Paramecium tetraurelia]|uniref:MORN repeat protein n=1 Tax=Paramecium tetraurelia TaxID=5888 RepID=A0BMT9_PARTE|nr:uncharacterized protein GSPATT00030492001 [Paramecium tetraurelia]CAK59856.1 unnamed protein product [Paramecium tetraurelia]|eukprot:XP_001427254.1 hypothetical protein (macronuclear) [Paramecium tetraurelia strain d4-2]